jgi:uncharacterized protein (TIGR00730 family)
MTAPTGLSVCIYCGSRHGDDAAFSHAAREVGRQIGERGWQLVYGGGNVGLMGEVADATLAAGGRVIGVIPDLLLDKEVGHRALTELHVVRNMHERKQLMAEKADAFLALPGGIGTFEELFEVWTWRHLGYHQRPIGLLNCKGFYDPLLAFMRSACESGFMDNEQMAMLTVKADPKAMLDHFAQQAPRPGAPDFGQV